MMSSREWEAELKCSARAKKAGRWNGQSALGPMCDAEKDWQERSLRASGEINGCQKFPLNQPEINFSFFIFEPPVAYFQKPFLML